MLVSPVRISRVQYVLSQPVLLWIKDCLMSSLKLFVLLSMTTSLLAWNTLILASTAHQREPWHWQNAWNTRAPPVPRLSSCFQSNIKNIVNTHTGSTTRLSSRHRRRKHLHNIHAARTVQTRYVYTSCTRTRAGKCSCIMRNTIRLL